MDFFNCEHGVGNRQSGICADCFSVLIAEEREACAKIVDEWQTRGFVVTDLDGDDYADEVKIAAAIRARHTPTPSTLDSSSTVTGNG